MISFSYVTAFAETKGTIAYLLPDSGGPFYPDAGKILKEFLQQEGYDLTILDELEEQQIGRSAQPDRQRHKLKAQSNHRGRRRFRRCRARSRGRLRRPEFQPSPLIDKSKGRR